jgi:hypothetical protein
VISEYNQENTQCGKLYRANNSFSLTTNCKEEKGERRGENLWV